MTDLLAKSSPVKSARKWFLESPRCQRLQKPALGLSAVLAGVISSIMPALSEVAGSEVIGRAAPGAYMLQTPETPIAREINQFHNGILLPFTIGIVILVAVLLAYVCIKFNAKANPVPSRTTHNALLEVAWTVIPVLMLVVIAVPSFRLLTHQLVIPKSDVTLKVTGKQWYWSYEYTKNEGGGFGFDSMMKPENELKADDLRLLSVDNEAVVPVGKNVHLQVVAADVIHSFVIPAFGVRIDAVPGRLNESWFRAEREGVYYGQCSKICGKDHAYMPIAIRVVSPEAYTAWLADAKKKFASAPDQVQTASVSQ